MSSLIALSCGSDSEDTVPYGITDEVPEQAAGRSTEEIREDSVEVVSPMPGTIVFNKMSFEGVGPGGSAKHTLWAIDPDGGEPKQVRSAIKSDAKRPEFNMSMACSRVLLADLTRYMGDNSPLKVDVMDFDGSNRISFIAPGSGMMTAPSWSPGADMIIYLRESEQSASAPDSGNSDFDIYIVDINGRLVRSFPAPVPVQGNIRWSPDGSKLAFTSASENNRSRDIYVMDVDGTNLVNVTSKVTVSESTVPGWDTLPAGSPENEAMYKTVEEMVADGILCERPESPDWSPDSKSLLYVADNYGIRQIWTVDLATLSNRMIWGPESNWKNPSLEKAVWAPDGKTIAFSSSSDEPEQMIVNHGADIWLINVDGSNPRLFYQSPDEEEMVGWMQCDTFPSVIGEPE